MAAKGREILIEVDIPETLAATNADITGLTYDNIKYYTGGVDSQPRNGFFKPDGTKFYLLGSSSGYVYSFTLATPWDLTTITFDGYGASINLPLGTVYGLYFKTDGTAFYFKNLSNGLLYRYTMSTAWLISSASYTDSRSLTTEDSNVRDIVISSDGAKMYALGLTNSKVYQYTLTTPWDITTYVYDGAGFDLDVSTELTTTYGLNISEDGIKLYVSGGSGGGIGIYQYTLSTAWNLATATYDSVFIATSAEVSLSEDIVFNADYTKLYVVGYQTSLDNGIYQYDVPLTPVADPGGYTVVGLLQSKSFSLNSASIDVTNFDSNDWRELDDRGLGDRSLDVSGSGVLDTTDAALVYMEDAVWEGYPVELHLTFPNGDYFSGTFKVTTFDRTGEMGGAVMFSMSIESSSSDSGGGVGGPVILNRYVAACSFNLATIPYDSVSFDLSPHYTSVDGMFMSADGLKMYGVDGAITSTAYVYEFDLGTAFDLSTAAYNSKRFDMVGQGISPRDVFFKPDGTRMFALISSGGVKVFQYDLGTPWDVTTAVYNSVVYDPTVTSNVRQLAFSSDGTSLIVQKSGFLYQYALSTPWDVSVVGAPVYSPAGTFSAVGDVCMRFNAAGTKFYSWSSIGGEGATAAVRECDLGTPWDVTTMTYSSVWYVPAEDGGVVAIMLGESLCRMYLAGDNTDAVYQYTSP